MPKLDALHICRKQQLWSLIRALGRLYGEDDEWLRVYAKERYEACIDDLDSAVKCFRSLVEGSRHMEKEK